MTLLITGASGFIGSYLSEYFVREGYTVIATARDISKIPDLPNPQFSKARWDVLESNGIAKPGQVIDAVIHTATSNDILSRQTDEGIRLSTLGTRNVLEFCVQQGISRMVFFSTFQVYGTDLEGTVDENSIPRPQNDYGINHLFGEQYVEMYAREKGINGIVVRPSNVYGRFSTPYINRWTLVPGCFCQEIRETGKIILKSSGRQARNFVSLENIGRALHQVLTSPPGGFDIYNIASSQNFSILEVAEMVTAVYYERYGKQGTIEILSEKPQRKNEFTVNLRKLYDLGFTENDTITLPVVINEIFNHLEK